MIIIRENLSNQFTVLWQEMLDKKLANNSLEIIENKNIFKFSPYNALNGEQNEVSINIINEIIDSFANDQRGVSLVQGCAGTRENMFWQSVLLIHW